MGEFMKSPKDDLLQGTDLLFIEASRVGPCASNTATSHQIRKGGVGFARPAPRLYGGELQLRSVTARRSRYGFQVGC